MEGKPTIKPVNSIDSTAELSPEAVNTPGIEEERWEKVAGDISLFGLGRSLEDEVKNTLEQEGYKCGRSSVVRGEAVFQKTIDQIFKGSKELKVPLKEIRGFRVRFTKVPEKVLQEEGLVMAVAYEVEITLETRYQMHGGKQNYVLGFIVKAKRWMDEEDLEGLSPEAVSEQRKTLFIKTTADSQKRSRAQAQIGRSQTEIVSQSQEEWKKLMYDRVRSMVSGGLPGHGKRRRGGF